MVRLRNRCEIPHMTPTRALWTVALAGAMLGCSKTKQDIDPAWLKEQTALVDGVCACTAGVETPVEQMQACMDQKQVGLLVATSPSGAGVDGNELYQRPEVKQLKARWSACAQKLEIRRRVEQEIQRPLAH
jgi:hypothetical protein